MIRDRFQNPCVLGGGIRRVFCCIILAIIVGFLLGRSDFNAKSAHPQPLSFLLEKELGPRTSVKGKIKSVDRSSTLFAQLSKGVVTASIKTFLRAIKLDVKSLDLHQDPKPTLHIIMGNQTGDLDSVVSAIAYAFLKGYEAAQKGQLFLVLPLVNIPQEDFRLNREVEYWLAQLGIAQEDLLFIDTLDLRELQKQGFPIQMTLVDHNQLVQHQKDLKPMVVEIIDHHEDKGEYDKNVNAQIVSVGSTSTLIAERIIRGTYLLQIVPELAQLLIGAIILDTVNLDEQKERVTERDRLVAEKLLSRGNLSQDAIWNSLNQAKSNLTGLSLEDLLRKDYKGDQVGSISYGISSIYGLSLQDLIHEEVNPLATLERIRTRYQIDLLLVLTAYEKSGTFHRELLIYTKDTVLLKQGAMFLQDDRNKTPPPQLRLISNKGVDLGDKGMAFTTASGLSRKLLDPMVHEFLSRLTNSEGNQQDIKVLIQSL